MFRKFLSAEIEYAAGFSGSCVSEDGKVFNISDPKEAELYCQQCSGKNAQVVSFEREDKKKKAPLLFSLADLQKEMGKNINTHRIIHWKFYRFYMKNIKLCLIRELTAAI